MATTRRFLHFISAVCSVGRHVKGAHIPKPHFSWDDTKYLLVHEDLLSCRAYLVVLTTRHIELRLATRTRLCKEQRDIQPFPLSAATYRDNLGFRLARFFPIG